MKQDYSAYCDKGNCGGFEDCVNQSAGECLKAGCLCMVCAKSTCHNAIVEGTGAPAIIPAPIPGYFASA